MHRIVVFRLLLLMQSFLLMRSLSRHMLGNLTSFAFVKLSVGVDYLYFSS